MSAALIAEARAFGYNGSQLIGRLVAALEAADAADNTTVPATEPIRKGGVVSITEFLLARIADDEATATAAEWVPDPDFPEESDYDDTWSTEHGEFAGRGGPIFRHILRNRPARVLAECAAKRAIVASCREDHEDAMASGDDTTALASEVLYAIAAVYADHPDYLQEWAL